jgi:glycosyltransferase involved in cell wall biosynthesis
VIVPVRNRRELLGDLLRALANQTVTDHEVIVVDDGSVDGSGDAARARAAAGQPVRVLDGAGRGAVAARRLGVAEAYAPVLAFTDSDCQPAHDWLERGLARITAGADVVQGRTEPTREVLPLERTVWVTAEDGLYATCNVFYRRDSLEAAGGFDQTAGRRIAFRPGRHLRDLGFGEDTLLGWRVRRLGRSEFAPEAVVRHHVFPPNLREYALRAWNAGGFTALVREVPDLRRVLLRHRVVLGPPTRLPLYGAALLAVAGRRRAALVAACGFVGGHAWLLRRAPGSAARRAAALPVIAGADVVTAASLVAGSARSRSLVL